MKGTMTFEKIETGGWGCLKEGLEIEIVLGEQI
jgi:hypothetical protein